MLEKQLIACAITCAVKIIWMCAVYLSMENIHLHVFKFEFVFQYALTFMCYYTTEEIQEYVYCPVLWLRFWSMLVYYSIQ